MPFTDIAPPPAPTPPGTGISFCIMERKRGKNAARLTIRAELQEQLFGRTIEGMTFSAQAGRGSDEGLLRLVVDPDGDLVAKKAMKGSVFISMAAWDLLPPDRRPSGPVKVKSVPSNVEVILELPAWAKPSGVDGKMAAEFGLKRNTGKGRK